MIVEMAGLPGSGKSTIARLLVEADPGVRRHVVAPSRATALRHPFTTLAESVRPSGIGPGTGWPAWPKLWLRWRQQQGRSPAASGLDLLEEGVTHHVWRALFRHPSLERTPWPRLLTLPHPLIILEADRATRMARVAGKSRRGRVNRQLALQGPAGGWERAEALMEAILAAVPADRTVIRVGSSGGLEATLGDVRVVLASLG